MHGFGSQRGNAIDQAMSCIPFLGTAEIGSLKAELPTYLSKAAGVSDTFDILEWWKLNCNSLPHWSSLTKKILLIQPSSGTTERVFSFLKGSFTEQQTNTLQDYIELSLMLQ